MSRTKVVLAFSIDHKQTMPNPVVRASSAILI